VRPVCRIEGRAAALDRPDVDTDQIIPKQFLKRIERTGFGEFLFHDWRTQPDFELNREEARGARILLAGRNFGCGSSREHAVWALRDAGFEAVIAPSFGDIFRNNALGSGLLVIELPVAAVHELMAAAPRGDLVVDLEQQVVLAPDGREHRFEIDRFRRECLLEGRDNIDLTLAREDEIAAFERSGSPLIDTTALV
jgi:3-isopropylmalate/(R)-2-methylmalate dehydratase small subunit